MSGLSVPRLANASEATPITVAGFPPRWMALPTIDGSPSNSSLPEAETQNANRGGGGAVTRGIEQTSRSRPRRQAH